MQVPTEDLPLGHAEALPQIEELDAGKEEVQRGQHDIGGRDPEHGLGGRGERVVEPDEHDEGQGEHHHGEGEEEGLDWKRME